MLVELHVIQSFPPSCLNRDDTNTPKDCMFGGVRRARVSSQCWKRSIRRQFREEETLADSLAVRTKRLHERVVQELAAIGRAGDGVGVVAEAALGAAGISLKDAALTQYLLFLPESTAARFAAVVDANYDALAAIAPDPSATGKAAKAAKKEAVDAGLKKQLEAALYGASLTPELALFGRMIADKPDVNIDAAAQVAHAISTNAVAPEFDFYTAVDDLKTRDEDAGADMMGTIGFSAPCFYRYTVLDTAQLLRNLAGGEADDEARALAASATAAYVRGFVGAIPSARQNSMAAHTPPSLVLAVVRDGGAPVSLANAFETPVRPSRDAGVVEGSIARLAKQWSRISAGLGDNGAVYVGFVDMTPDGVQITESLSGEAYTACAEKSVPGLVDRLTEVVRGGL